MIILLHYMYQIKIVLANLILHEYWSLKKYQGYRHIWTQGCWYLDCFLKVSLICLHLTMKTHVKIELHCFCVFQVSDLLFHSIFLCYLRYELFKKGSDFWQLTKIHSYVTFLIEVEVLFLFFIFMVYEQFYQIFFVDFFFFA